ncbi:MAG TPA: hypothetical protein VFP84_03025 [Kofleriaceae bacterium]|nr:hypothetical protein [Kofleriaceae bacterium]
MVLIGEHGAAATCERGVDVPRGGDLKALHAARERDLVVGFDDQVNVGALNAQLDDPDAFVAGRDLGGSADRAEDREPTQVADVRRGAKHDVHREARGEPRTGAVRGAGARAAGLATGAASLAAMWLEQSELHDDLVSIDKLARDRVLAT